MTIFIISQAKIEEIVSLMVIKEILLVVVFAFVFTIFVGHQASGEGDCYYQKVAVFVNRDKTIRNGIENAPPSSKCCQAIRKADMICVCHSISVEDEHFISAARIVGAVQVCAKPLPAGTKCGSN